MKGTGAKRNVCPGSCVSTGAKFPVAPVESAPMLSGPTRTVVIIDILLRTRAAMHTVTIAAAADWQFEASAPHKIVSFIP